MKGLWADSKWVGSIALLAVTRTVHDRTSTVAGRLHDATRPSSIELNKDRRMKANLKQVALIRNMHVGPGKIEPDPRRVLAPTIVADWVLREPLTIKTPLWSHIQCVFWAYFGHISAI